MKAVLRIRSMVFGILTFLAVFAFYPAPDSVSGSQADPLGPQSVIAHGEQSVLVLAVRFPGTSPSFTVENIRKRIISSLDAYVREQSYGQTWINADFRGWVDLPDPLSTYEVSPYNFKVDRKRVRKLIEDTMSAVEKDVDFSRYRHILIIPGVHTQPGKGYGMLCYCANPGMLTGVKGKLDYAVVKSKSGREFRGGIFLGAENAHPGMFAHDFFHALGGIRDGKRLVPCLYDFERQSDSSHTPQPEKHAIYMGPWDIMSEHFVKKGEPQPGISSFTKIRLGWISPDKAVISEPGTSSITFLSPLNGSGEGRLVVKIPFRDGTYYLIENRQAVGHDRNLPDFGIVILRVNPAAPEGYGTVEVMNANPKAPHFSRAPFKLDPAGGNRYTDRKNDIVIIPLWEESGKTGVLVTTPDRSDAALTAALSIGQFMKRHPEPRNEAVKMKMNRCVDAFRAFNFTPCGE